MDSPISHGTEETTSGAAFYLSPYDIRKTVQTTGPIVGSVGGFVVTAVVLILTIAPSTHRDQALIGLASGLLALALIGCLAGAFALGSLAGEGRLTVNLSTAASYMSVGPTIAIVAILAAFQVLSSMYLPHSKYLFTMMVALIGAAASVFNCTGPLEEWDIRTNPHDNNVLPQPSTWITSRQGARRWSNRLAIAGALPVVVGFILYSANVTVALSTAGVTIFVGVGMVIIVLSSLKGLIRCLHPDDGRDRGTELWEALTIQTLTGAYIGTILIFLH
jgi:hypothetical protein